MKGKKITSGLLALLVFFSVFAGAFAGSAAGQTYSETIEVSSPSELADLGNQTHTDKRIVLTSDINMSGVSYQPFILDNSSFDGQGHTISSLDNVSAQSANTHYDNHYALIAFSENSEVHNLDISVNITEGQYAAGIVAESTSTTFQNVGVTGTLNPAVTDAGYTGGVVAEALDNTTIDTAQVDLDIDSDANQVGGVVGHLGDSAVYNSSANGDVSGSNYVGGVAGYVNDGLDTAAIENSYSLANVSGGTAGGITATVFATSNGITLSDSYAAGGVSGTTVGGAVGEDASSASVSATNIFYDTTSSGTGQTSSALGTGQTTSFMTGSDAVSNMNFDADVWYTTDSYPVLSTEQYSGTVYEPDQTAFDGANVTFYNSTGSELATLTTGADGSWSYDGSADVQSIEISADGYYTASIDSPSTVVDYSTTLTEGSDGAGLAVIASYNDSGDAIQDGTVSITGLSSASAELDQNGVASFSNLDAGDYTVTLSSQNIQSDVTTNVTIEAGQSETVSLSGKAFNTITGTITDTGGNPIPGVTAELTRTVDNETIIEDTQISDENGSVTFENVPDGNYTIQWSVYDTTFEETVNVSDPGDNEITISSSNDFTTGEFKITVKQDESVFGGDPISDATVYVFSKDNTKVATLTTNADGVATAELATNDGYWFQPVKSGYTTYHSNTDLGDGVTIQVYENQATTYTAPLGPALEPAPTLTVNTTVDGEPVEANVTITEQYIGTEVLNGTASNGTVDYLNPYSGGYYVIDAEYSENGTTYTADETYRIAENGTNTVNLALQSESAGGGGFFGDSSMGLVVVVLVGGAVVVIYLNSNGGNGGSGRSRSRSGQYART